MINHRAVFANSQFSFKLPLLCSLVLFLSGCAGNGMQRAPELGAAQADENFVVPAYVQNLPKSSSGNMAQYTVFGKQYRTMDSAANFSEQGVASWYGEKFHGRKTSSGEIYDMHAMTAAHKHLPLPTFVRVTNLENNKSVVVKVNDRGPFVGDRIIDMSYTAAKLLGMVDRGTATVRVDALSTHFVDENPIGSNVNVAQLFEEHNRNSAEQAAAAEAGAQPDVLLPEVSAVPDQPVLQAAMPVVAEVEPYDQNGVATISVDGSEDGFVESTDSPSPVLGAASLAPPQEPVLNQPSEVVQTIASAPTSSPDVQPGGNSYYIQLGAFSQASNAHAMVDDVDEQTGLPAYVERDSDRNLFRVKMGPFQQGTLLENTLQSLASMGIDSYTKQASSY